MLLKELLNEEAPKYKGKTAEQHLAAFRSEHQEENDDLVAELNDKKFKPANFQPAEYTLDVEDVKGVLIGGWPTYGNGGAELVYVTKYTVEGKNETNTQSRYFVVDLSTGGPAGWDKVKGELMSKSNTGDEEPDEVDNDRFKHPLPVKSSGKTFDGKTFEQHLKKFYAQNKYYVWSNTRDEFNESKFEPVEAKHGFGLGSEPAKGIHIGRRINVFGTKEDLILKPNGKYEVAWGGLRRNAKA